MDYSSNSEPQLTYMDLVSAASMGNLERVNQAIEAEVDLNAYHPGSLPALICAACNNNLKIADTLLVNGADVNVATADRKTALKTAAMYKHTDMVKLLLQYGADPNYEKNGQVALTIACDNSTEQDAELIEILMKVTDRKYYQKAYECCHVESLRKLIKSLAPDMAFTEPEDGFGGETYKKNQLYETPPKHKLYLQLWSILTMYEAMETNPNRTFPAVLYKTAMMQMPEIYQEDCEQNSPGPEIDDFGAGICNWVFDKVPLFKELCPDIYAQVKDNHEVDVEAYI